MNILLVLVLLGGMDLYFLKDSSDLLLRIIPETQTEQISLYYSFSDTNWDSVVVKQRGKFFDAVITPPVNLDIVGFYAIYDNGDVDDNNGYLYLYEVKRSPRMIMPISMAELETILSQAEMKITANVDIDEAITLLNYVENTLVFLPVVRNSSNEVKKNMLLAEVENLREQIGY